MRFFCFFSFFFFYTFKGMNHAFWLLGAKGEVANFMTKMTCDQEHRTQVDTTWRHNGISDSHTDENSVIGVKKSASNRGIFNKNTQTIMKFSSEWIQEHLCLRWELSQWVYLFIFDHIVSLLQCAVNKLVQPGAGSPARLGVLHEKSKSMYVIWSANFGNQFYSEIQF